MSVVGLVEALPFPISDPLFTMMEPVKSRSLNTALPPPSFVMFEVPVMEPSNVKVVASSIEKILLEETTIAFVKVASATPLKSPAKDIPWLPKAVLEPMPTVVPIGTVMPVVPEP